LLLLLLVATPDVCRDINLPNLRADRVNDRALALTDEAKTLRECPA